MIYPPKNQTSATSEVSYGSDLTGFYQSFIKVIFFLTSKGVIFFDFTVFKPLKSGSSAGIIEKSRKCNAYAQL
jgi:hypothetical protein